MIATLKPKLVLQPWTEDPEIPEDATGPFTTGSSSGGQRLRLGDVQLGLHHLHQAAQKVVDDIVPELEKRKGVTKTAASQIKHLGMNNIKNEAAVKGIQDLSGEHLYLKFADPVDVSDILPGVTIDVLGPPSIDQSSEVAKMTDK